MDVEVDNMEKPITIKRAEFMQNMAQTINQSGLPAFVIADCMSMTLAEIKALADKQLKMDLETWEASKEREVE